MKAECELVWCQQIYFNCKKYFSLIADIDDMKIYYVLLDTSNATSDIFYFTVEDNGKNILSFQLIAKLSASACSEV